MQIGQNSYMFFNKEKRADISATNPDMSFGDVGKEVGRLWKECPAPDKEVCSAGSRAQCPNTRRQIVSTQRFEKMAVVDKERYTREMLTVFLSL